MTSIEVDRLCGDAPRILIRDCQTQFGRQHIQGIFMRSEDAHADNREHVLLSCFRNT